ncbi:chemotaxis protein [Oscillatoriales cyanobacterium USR001]|nr:chemotaxis protein [Oscillatoriales cyanobacterium USR001]
MAITIDFEQEYQRAEVAYGEGNYDEAANLVYQLVENFPEDPSARLLCGHIYCYGLQQYDVAREQYMVVLSLTDDPGFVEHANNGIAYAEQFTAESPAENFETFSEDIDLEMYAGLSGEGDLEEPDLSIFGGNDQTFPLAGQAEMELTDPDLTGAMGLLGLELEDNNLENYVNDAEFLNPFDSSSPFNSGESEAMPAYSSGDLDAGLELGGLDFEDEGMELADTQLTFAPQSNNLSPAKETKKADLSVGGSKSKQLEKSKFAPPDPSLDLGDFILDDMGAGAEDFDEMFAPLELPDDLNFDDAEPVTEKVAKSKTASMSGDLGATDSAYSMSKETSPFREPSSSGSSKTNRQLGNRESGLDLGKGSNFSVAEDETLLMGDARNQAEAASNARRSKTELNAFKPEGQSSSTARQNSQENGFNMPESFDLDEFDDNAFADSFTSDNDLPSRSFGMAGPDSDFPTTPNPPNGRADWIDDFDEFGDVGNIPDFDISDDANSSLLTGNSNGFGGMTGTVVGSTTSNLDFGDNSDGSAIRDDEIFNIAGTPESVSSFTPTEEHIDATVTVEQGGLAFLENAPLMTKQLYTAIGTGLISLVTVAMVTNFASYQARQQNKPEVIGYLRQTGWVMTAAAGFTSFLTAWGLGHLVAKQVSQSTKDLQLQFDSISQGNLEARATVYAEDEFGKMSAKFNHMAKVILTTTSDARRKADEQEQAKEDLQRQVIRLLDDVEGAARGDLTVQAEVTADVLGAVADSFNLTIQNLREIVHQVKQAARDVSTGASASSTFAQGLSSDALRQAEELAATLNSVQVLTDAIQRVAESAREAEEVARGASASALKGGEAVERTVAGILEIRETVAETTRKVKRLAEASQEISKIVALIATIASRTNLLALNASIEAARAGEAGRGFAIVADEVRQLADRSAKSLKEIEQIVMQIQSETGAVMTAMEEGTQQVIEGTRLAEQAKRSLEDIIQVTNRIDVLVRSITSDCVEQNETARAVAQVMQAVELTAQETSQESQRVYGSLQNLVGVARDLLTSVERFRVETAERQ